jgi:hypothetical protein
LKKQELGPSHHYKVGRFAVKALQESGPPSLERSSSSQDLSN